jgi:asparagine synthase (glutamine-hydrolysing)
MCGIAGFVQKRGSPPGQIDRMTELLRHRGPDGCGSWSNANHHFNDWIITLGHRRLSIIDIKGGAQPMANEDDSFHITYNGEVYNFRELRLPLELAGHHFATRCDTEVVLQHCQRHGVQGLKDLDGMFAFALWDDAKQTLLLARDRVGVKPLYYAPLPDGGIAFASELRALLGHPVVDRCIDPHGLASMFFLDYAHAPHTVVRGARKLQPGHYLIWSPDGLQPPLPYWQLQCAANEPDGGPSSISLALRLRSLLADSVEAQLISDAPLGVFLSGGIDSSMVAALACRKSKHRLKTFSIGFDDPEFDESGYARLVARHIGSEHVEETLDAETLLGTIDEALNCLDEPMGDPSILPTYILSRLAAKHVKVALGGDGGDELWAGYPTCKAHRYAQIYRRIPSSLRAGLFAPIIQRLPTRDGYQRLEWKAKRFALRWEDVDELRHLRWMSATDLPDLNLAMPKFRHGTELMHEIAGDCRGADLINRILALDFGTYLPGSVLAKVDRASMANGLEVRPPMLGNALIDYAFSLSGEIKTRHGVPKHLLKLAAEGVLPHAIIHRKKKGFAVPLSRWLRGPLCGRIESILRESPLWDMALLCRGTFEKWNDEHQRLRCDRSKPLWGLIVLDHWVRRMPTATPALAPDL